MYRGKITTEQWQELVIAGINHLQNRFGYDCQHLTCDVKLCQRFKRYLRVQSIPEFRTRQFLVGALICPVDYKGGHNHLFVIDSILSHFLAEQSKVGLKWQVESSLILNHLSGLDLTELSLGKIHAHSISYRELAEATYNPERSLFDFIKTKIDAKHHFLEDRPARMVRVSGGELVTVTEFELRKWVFPEFH